MLRAALLWLIKKIASEGNDTCWLKCIPLYHFISNDCEPFQSVPQEVNHSDTKPVWWGITDFNREVRTFQMSGWKRYVCYRHLTS